MTTLLIVIIVILFVFLVPQLGGYKNEYVFEFTFEEDQEGWIMDFADLPSEHDPVIYEMNAGYDKLPSDLEGNATYLSGHNRSDDLFMFLIKLIDGLKPDTSYQVFFSIDLANNTPEGMMGIGGSPGESVYVKVGAVSYEPEVIEESDGWLRMNIDKGNQAMDGEDMVTIGTLANPNIDLSNFTGEEYAIMTLNNTGQAFSVTSDNNGVVWLIVGTDSGFEGMTTVYYSVINIIFTEE